MPSATLPRPPGRGAAVPCDPYPRGLYRRALASRLRPGNGLDRGRGALGSFGWAYRTVLRSSGASRLTLLLFLFASFAGELFLLLRVMIVRLRHVHSVSSEVEAPKVDVGRSRRGRCL
jgi:hypothetical protein